MLIIAPEEFITELLNFFDDKYKILSLESLIKPISMLPVDLDMYDYSCFDSSSPLLIQHSSGTTGLKKGVVLDSQSVNMHVKSYSLAIGLCAEDVIVSWLPMYHDMGFVACLLMPLLLGVKTVLIDPFLWVSKPYLLFEAIDKHSGSLVWMPNFGFNLLNKSLGRKKLNYDLSSVRAFINCSEPCKRSTFLGFFESFERLGIRLNSLHCSYAMAENVFAVTQTNLSKSFSDFKTTAHNNTVVDSSISKYINEYLSCGEILNGVDLLIVDDSGCVVPDGVVGEITLKSDFMFQCYYLRPELTHLKFRNERYCTGDLGFLYNSEVYIIGRIDDVIVSHGKKIIAHEVEDYLSAFDFIKPGRVLLIPFLMQLSILMMYILYLSQFWNPLLVLKSILLKVLLILTWVLICHLCL